MSCIILHIYYYIISPFFLLQSILLRKSPSQSIFICIFKKISGNCTSHTLYVIFKAHQDDDTIRFLNTFSHSPPHVLFAFNKSALLLLCFCSIWNQSLVFPLSSLLASYFQETFPKQPILNILANGTMFCSTCPFIYMCLQPIGKNHDPSLKYSAQWFKHSRHSNIC